MYEITYTIDGIIKKFSIKADDGVQALSIFTNMYTGQKYDIINVRRV